MNYRLFFIVSDLSEKSHIFEVTVQNMKNLSFSGSTSVLFLKKTCTKKCTPILENLSKEQYLVC